MAYGGGQPSFEKWRTVLGSRQLLEPVALTVLPRSGPSLLCGGIEIWKPAHSGLVSIHKNGQPNKSVGSDRVVSLPLDMDGRSGGVCKFLLVI